MSWIRRLAVHRRPSDPLAQNRSWDFGHRSGTEGVSPVRIRVNKPNPAGR
jgi:hypothetical protein